MQSDSTRTDGAVARGARLGDPAASVTDEDASGSASVPLTRAQLRAARAAAVLETPVDEAPVGEKPAAEAPVPEASVPSTDDTTTLEAALRSLAETPCRTRAPQIAYMPPVPTASATPPRAPRAKRAVTRKIAAASFSFGVMGIVGLFALATTAPAEALAAAVSDSTSTAQAAQSLQAPSSTGASLQTYVASGDVETNLDRSVDSYSTQSTAEVAAESGITKPSNLVFTNDSSASIQWPFAVGVPITDAWGPRWGSFHHGVDFTPGIGADIQAVADGTVRIATNSGGLYGTYVVIDHVIDGQQVSSLYAHMLTGSLKVKVGQQVTVGTILGNTGDTGFSFGPHTHFEITVNGTRINPLPWLQQNAGRHL